MKEFEDKLEILERQLKHDTESSKSLTNEKQAYLKQINELEQQISERY